MGSVWHALGGPPHPVIVTIGDNRDYSRVLLYSYLFHYYRVGGPPKACYMPRHPLQHFHEPHPLCNFCRGNVSAVEASERCTRWGIVDRSG